MADSSDQTPTELPQGKKVLIFTFNLDTTTKGILPEDTAENKKIWYTRYPTSSKKDGIKSRWNWRY